MINCLRCNSAMTIRNVNNVEIDICPNCHGIWFDKDELGKVSKVSSSTIATSIGSAWDKAELKKYDEVPGESEFLCPRCKGEMERYYYAYSSGIMLDSCKDCKGIWMDGGELLKIFEYLGECEKELDPEKEAELMASLKAIQAKQKMEEEKLIDSLVRMDDTGRNPFSRGLGECLQFVYRIFYKLGL